MTSDNTIEFKPKALFENPFDQDKLVSEREIVREVKDSRPIESGDIIFEMIEIFDHNGDFDHSTIRIKIATFKPGEAPQEFNPGHIPYPRNEQSYIEALFLIEAEKNRHEGKLEIDFPGYNTAFTFEHFSGNDVPMKSVYKELFKTKLGSGPIRLETKSSSHILDARIDIPALDLSNEQQKTMLNKASEIRKAMAVNLPDMVDTTTGLTNPRLQQLDNLINYLSTEIYFKN